MLSRSERDGTHTDDVEVSSGSSLEKRSPSSASDREEAAAMMDVHAMRRVLHLSGVRVCRPINTLTRSIDSFTGSFSNPCGEVNRRFIAVADVSSERPLKSMRPQERSRRSCYDGGCVLACDTR